LRRTAASICFRWEISSFQSIADPDQFWKRSEILSILLSGESQAQFRYLEILAEQAITLSASRLSLAGIPVSDLKPLAGLAALRELYLGQAPVSDLGPVAGLTALQRLSLRSTPVSDLKPLAGLTALQRLQLGGTQVSDLRPLAALVGLHELYLNQTPVSDLGP